jgi:raffinose/stachyose/melibiose transport system substrate-binding protein
LIKNFENVYPNVTIIPQYGASADLALQVPIRFQGGNPPDLLSVSGGASTPWGLWTLGPRGANGLADLSGSPWVKRIIPSVRPYMSVKHHIYGAPVALAPLAIMYNVDVFNSVGLKPPTLASELIADCDKLKAAGKIPIAFNGSSVTTTYFTEAAGPFVYASDPKWTIERYQHKVTFAGTPGWTRALEFWLQMKDHCFSPGATATSITAGNTQFATGQAGMIIAGSAMYGAVLAINPSANLSMFVLPGDKASNDVFTVGVSQNLAVAKNAANATAAKAFVDFIMRPKQDALFNKIQGTISVSDLKAGNYPTLLAAMKANAELGTIIAPSSGWSNGTILPTVTQQLIGLLTGQVATTDAALQVIDKAWETH